MNCVLCTNVYTKLFVIKINILQVSCVRHHQQQQTKGPNRREDRTKTLKMRRQKVDEEQRHSFMW